MNPTDQQCACAIRLVEDAYTKLPETTCQHRTCCCRAGCPNMYFCEFINIYSGAVAEMPTEKRLDLTVECVRRYLTPQTPGQDKPCVHLDGEMCSVYKFRPLKCRLYGLIPDSLYEWIVGEVSKEGGVPKEKLPLCEQCPHVRVKADYVSAFPDGKVPEAMIKFLETRLRENDVALGLPIERQEKGHGFLTYHDWHVMFELGEGWMESLTKLRISLPDEKKEHFIAAMKEGLRPLFSGGDQKEDAGDGQ